MHILLPDITLRRDPKLSRRWCVFQTGNTPYGRAISPKKGAHCLVHQCGKTFFDQHACVCVGHNGSLSITRLFRVEVAAQ